MKVLRRSCVCVLVVVLEKIIFFKQFEKFCNYHLDAGANRAACIFFVLFLEKTYQEL